jgi:hypothetical protein
VKQIVVKAVKLAILFLFFLFDSIVLFVKRIFGKGNPRVLVLIYHDVTSHCRQRFVRQLEMIKKYTTVIRAEKGYFPDKATSPGLCLFPPVTWVNIQGGMTGGQSGEMTVRTIESWMKKRWRC